VRGRVDVLGQPQRLQVVLVALDEAGVVDDVELRMREKRGMAERSVGERSTASSPSTAATSASTAPTDESGDEATVVSPPGRLRETRG
jgi:hypothetical protein